MLGSRWPSPRFTGSGPELVVVVVLDAGGRQEAVEGLEVLVGGARTAVERQDRELGLLPVHLVQTSEVPAGVVTGIRRVPPGKRSSSDE